MTVRYCESVAGDREIATADCHETCSYFFSVCVVVNEKNVCDMGFVICGDMVI